MNITNNADGSSRTVRIDDRVVGVGAPCFLVAEIGINHNGDMALAAEMIAAAAEAGADSVKFQNYRTEDFLSDRSLEYTYLSQGQTITESQWDMFKRCELSTEQLAQLKEQCDRAGVVFHSTPTSRAGIEELTELGVPVMKNGSDYLTNLDLIAAFAETRLPLVLSTGMATLAEIDDAIRCFRQHGGTELIVLHCTSLYPTPPKYANLRKIPALTMALGVPVGFSDHTIGVSAAVASVVLGACWIEKHFTIDKELPGPDHRFSADPSEFAALVSAVRNVEQQLGDAAIGPSEMELESRADFRLSCVAARSMEAGAVLTKNGIAFRRPGTGIPPAEAYLLEGRRLKHAVSAGHIFSTADFV